VVGKLRQQRGFLAFVGQRDVDDVDGQQFRLARIEAALVHMQLAMALACRRSAARA
jgi:hypothetical protein